MRMHARVHKRTCEFKNNNHPWESFSRPSSFARFYHLESYFFEKKAELDCMQITVLLPMLLQTFSTIALSKLERTHTGTTHTVAPNVTSNIGLL